MEPIYGRPWLLSEGWDAKPPLCSRQVMSSAQQPQTSSPHSTALSQQLPAPDGVEPAASESPKGRREDSKCRIQALLPEILIA